LSFSARADDEVDSFGSILLLARLARDCGFEESVAFGIHPKAHLRIKRRQSVFAIDKFTENAGGAWELRRPMVASLLVSFKFFCVTVTAGCVAGVSVGVVLSSARLLVGENKTTRCRQDHDKYYERNSKVSWRICLRQALAP
jgi:hypothetical protein